MSMTPESQDDPLQRLVQVTYAATTNPQQFDSLLGAWDQYMAGLGELGENEDHAPYFQHFNQALEIMGVLGRRRRSEDQSRDLLSTFSTPAFICTATRRISDMNDRASQLFGQPDPGLITNQSAPDMIASDPRETLLDYDFLQEPIARLRAGGGTEIAPVFSDDMRLIDCAVVARLPADDTASGRAEDRFLVVLTKPDETTANWKTLCDRFDFSAAESAVLRHLINGANAEDISRTRSVSLATTRTQIRRLLEKTGAANQTDLVRQCLLICSQMELVELVGSIAGSHSDRTTDIFQELFLPDGRLMKYLDLGDPSGDRVAVLLHGMVDGPALRRAMQEEAAARGWRILAPSRPGFGGSDPVPLEKLPLVERACDDVAQLLNKVGADRALVIGHMSAAGIANRFLTRQSARCSGVLNIGHAGLMDDALFDAFPNPMRSMARTYRRSEIASRLIVRVALASIDLFGPESMIRNVTQHSRWDSDAFETDAEFRQFLNEGLSHNTRQGGDAFTKDGFTTLTDWHKDLSSSSLPRHCMIGDDCRVYPLAHAQRLAARIEGYNVIPVEQGGQFILHTHWEQVLKQMDCILPPGT